MTPNSNYADHVCHHLANVLDAAGLHRPFVSAGMSISAVTTSWGVQWDEQEIARDILQNFYDANRDHAADISVQVDAGRVTIRAPATFDLKRLFYLGSEKRGDDDSIGQYGEGFKAAAMCLLRDHHVEPVIVSGYDILALRIADQTIGGTQMRPIEYHFHRSEQSHDGSELVLVGCSPRLSKALAQGMTHFLHEGNPLLGDALWNNHDDAFSLHRSTTSGGHLFYRRLKRGVIDGIPLVLGINRPYASIEARIGKDRDRKGFGDEVQKVFFRHYARDIAWHADAIIEILNATRHLWESGHPLLSAIAEARRRYGSQRIAAALRFDEGFFARCGRCHDNARTLQTGAIERRWLEAGRIALPAYFTHFGASDAESEIVKMHQCALEASRKQDARPATDTERSAIGLLNTVLGDLAPAILSVFNTGDTHYTVTSSDVLLGELKKGRGWRSREVLLSESVFTSDFASALAIHLHEHAHIFGHDGSRGFSDALTELIEATVRCQHMLDAHEHAWTTMRARIVEERKASSSGLPEEKAMGGWLDTLDQQALRQLLEQVPPAQLRKLRRAGE